MSICKTKVLKGAVEYNEALNVFMILKESIDWEAGIHSRRHGYTRKAKPLMNMEIPLIDELIYNCLRKITNKKYIISHIYLNYYENGNMFTPNHNHPGTHQLVISLGDTRTLNVGKKSYLMENGDIILFGSSIHGVPKEENKEGRISIATFMVPI